MTTQKAQRFTGIGHVQDGIWMLGRFSIGWNLHRTRKVKTVAVGVALSLQTDCVIVTVGPVTLVWLLEPLP